MSRQSKHWFDMDHVQLGAAPVEIVVFVSSILLSSVIYFVSRNNLVLGSLVLYLQASVTLCGARCELVNVTKTELRCVLTAAVSVCQCVRSFSDRSESAKARTSPRSNHQDSELGPRRTSFRGHESSVFNESN